DPLTEMDIAADSAAALNPPPEVWDHYKNLVEQAQKLFGAHHYRDYHFLYTLSDQVAPYDWRALWTERLTNHGPGAPLGGIDGSGWKLVYDDAPSDMMTGMAAMYHFVPAAFDVG